MNGNQATQNLSPAGQTMSNPAVSAVPTNNSDNQSTAKKVSGSPWDEDVDIPETPKQKNPAVIGSLDSTPKKIEDDKEQAPLKVPNNIEEKVGIKIPGDQFINKAATIAPVEGTQSEQIVQQSPAKSTGQVQNQPAVPAKPKLFFEDLNQISKKDSSVDYQVPKNPPPTPVKPIAKSPIAAIQNKIGPFKKPAATNVPKVAEKVELDNKITVTGKTKSSIGAKIGWLCSGLALVFVLLCALTEFGFLSLGLENVYGKIGIEKMWGGLSIDAESAMVRSYISMSKYSDYKINGTINLTVNSAKESEVMSPLFSFLDEAVIEKNDIRIGRESYTEKATKVSSVDSSLPQAPAVSSSASSTSTTNTTGLSNFIKEISAKVSLKSSQDSSEANFELNDSAGTTVSLVNKGKSLFVKKTNNTNRNVLEWSLFDIEALKDKNISSNFFNLKTNTGLSIEGERVGSEKIGSERCYRYKISNIEIGNSLSSFGITSDFVQKASGEVWIGVRDKLIKKANLTIIPPISTSASLIKVNINFDEYGVSNSITQVNQNQIGDGGWEKTLTGDEKRKADIKKILDALNKYKIDNNAFPLSNDLLKLNTNSNIISEVLVPKYLTTMPEDPKAIDGWYYAYKSDGQRCSISSRLENQTDPQGQLINNVLLYLKYNDQIN